MESNNNQNNTTTSFKAVEQRRYGLLSLLSMVIGMVIGAGIFFKNPSMYQNSQSALLSMSAWVLMIMIVLFMIVGYIEIASSTKYTKQQGTLSNWAHNFIGPKTGKIISYYFGFVYIPITIASFAIYAAGQILYSTNPGWLEYATIIHPWLSIGLTAVISIGLMAFFFFMNTFSSKPGKIFQVSGTALKLIPLVVVVLTIIVMGVMVSLGDTTVLDSQDFTNVWDPNSGINSGINTNYNNPNQILNLFIFTLPGVMFAFDGFVFSASLQTEAKKQSTFKWALIIGMILISVIYFLFSWAVFTSATYDNGYDVSSGAIIANLFPNQTSWLPLTFSIIIAISILNAMSGSIITYSRTFASMSEHNHVVDSNGKLLRRNKVLVPYNLFIYVEWVLSN